MRTLLLALMIALLPIRGWLGDAMAFEMVQHSLPAAAAHCQDAMDASGAMGKSDPATTHDGNHGAGQQNCGTCGACQVCHTVALGGMPRFDAPRTAPHAPPASYPARFASAAPAPGLKPPIS
jgi:hypothetical protein